MSPSLSRRQVLAGVGAASTAAIAGPASSATARATTTQEAPSTEDVESLVDDLVETSLEAHDVPGATVAVVVDGDIALTKGYGVADRNTDTAVDAEQTLFRAGSVSKAVLWTAIMQRVTSGDINPNAPVSTYLDDIQLSTPYDEPITMAHLATHRAGFEASNRGLWIRDPTNLRPLSTHLKTAQPACVRPPGEVGSYSNYGAALAGGVLASVTNTTFTEAIDSQLLTPAGMSSSSFEQPLPDSLASRHATGYPPGDVFADGEFPYVGLRPAGSMSTTAADMARFMQIHLNDGVVDGERVLASETVDSLHEQWATHHDQLPGMAFGLLEKYYGDVRTLWHNGSTIAFHSDLLLVPERGLGLFVSYNGSGGAAARSDVTAGFLDALLPDPETRSLTPDGRPTKADALEGTYRSLRTSKTGHDRLTTTLQAQTISVSIDDDGALVTESGGRTNRWVETAPLVFEHVSEQRTLAFGESDDGIEHLFVGSNPATAYGRIGVQDKLTTHMTATAASVLVLLSGVVGWPILAAIRRFRGSGNGSVLGRLRQWRTHPALASRVAVGGAAGTLFGFLVLAVGHFASQPFSVLSTPPLTFRVLFALPIVAAIGTAAAGLLNVTAWRTRGLGAGRIHETAVVLSLVVLCAVLEYWNLMTPP
ncbi:penicillin-binding protein, beta-lactamase class c [Halogeometricum borinquense DSM 11551]|uniref:Penicillin-binding protein, Beta-lactamase class C n=1 Tax=Halogeometricum borinquense (strain ATCC 700274 / DSM 11551 / JCM 10706 / KCTC 4070 / PR3) TaxID=469382 RepID=E4NSE6_HALBP|nr:serine hydrolase domain-containing protein [Halogeometricum borinquense]ADQ66935.1 penicillin-binding protein, beta-lactamase class C [Halogeometricum borinquense DSM 11551]ELY30441.1 penicillin-binding protein, beta-lactamase class c [Halogeometricum borinquense DSM 11551]